MSHNYPYRRPPPDTDLRQNLGTYSSSDRHHPATPTHHDFYRAHQEPPPSRPSSFSSSYTSSSSSSRGLAVSAGAAAQLPPSQVSPDGALSILSSCGLEPSDLALLAELPEDVLTVESLPHLLQQIKGKKGTVKPFPPNAPSSSSASSSSSYPASAVRRPAGEWDHLRNQPVQYPLDQLPSNPLPSEQVQDRWGTRNSSSVSYTPSSRTDPPPPLPSSSSSSSSSSYMVDYSHRGGPSDYGKTVRDAGQTSSQDRHFFSSPAAGRGRRSRPSRFSQPADYRSAPPPPEEYHQRPRAVRREFEASSSRSSSSSRVSTTNTPAPPAPAATLPSTKEALDFHGTTPTVYPYSCSLCDITVLSDKVWIKHINGTQHADGQLSLLQHFPNWDCRLETVSRFDNQPQKRKDEGKPAQLDQIRPDLANQSTKPQPNKKSQKKASEKGKVVCVKFPPQSVDETYLRKLSDPFGKIVKILMFPSLAFVELGSVDQAKDLVKFHNNYPPTVNGEQMEFSISNTFNFLQSSRVVSFTPTPTGEDGQSDLISIVKRFGPPLYTLFLPSMAFVEMKIATDAEKLVDYYSSNTLRINSDFIKVSFSGEYKSLMRVQSAKRYEEETEAKRKRSPSTEREDKRTKSGRTDNDGETETARTDGEKTRSSTERNRSSTERNRSSTERNRSSTERNRSRDTTSRDKRSRSRSKSKSRDESRETSSSRSSRQNRSRERRSKSRERKTRSRGTKSRSRSKERRSASREKRSKSRSRERRSKSKEKTAAPEKLVKSETTESRTEAEPPPKDSEPETAEKEASEPEADESSAEESDIEGMEVIGEDGENLEDEDLEKEEEDEEKEEQGRDKKTELPEEPDFPVDLENCITLDEVEESDEPVTEGEEEQEEEGRNEPEGPSTRVVYFSNLPLCFYTDVQFIGLVKGFGTAVRYFLIRRRREGFIEMSSSSEAVRAASELSCKSVCLNGSKLTVHISHKYSRLTAGWPVQSDEDMNDERRSQSSSRRSERRSKSKTSEEEESRARKERESGSRKTPERESGSKRTPERESGSRKTPERESGSRKTPERESGSKKTPERESGSKKTPERESGSKKTPEKESGSKKTPGRESGSKKTPERESLDRKTPERESGSKKTPERESLDRKTPERESGSKKTPERDEERKERKTSEEDKKTPGETENKENLLKRKASDESDSEKKIVKKELTREKSEEESEKDPDQPDSTADPQRPQAEQEPAEGATAPLKPSKPVGTEFVRPVVGYFCNLCHVIYADEDEAKLQHCSSQSHYAKYQEQTGKDPWTS
ncbi:matrin 3-like 1.1 [Scomber japonicus]|uniref:matrin 3-like 1.1 n=1 Tax=Scomber japonicus TaxID=13676 RepID=UPI0023068AF9|nr:matrin 3-like 1.1 [Scomber japonicus]